MVFFVMAVFDWHSDVVLNVAKALHLYIPTLKYDFFDFFSGELSSLKVLEVTFY